MDHRIIRYPDSRLSVFDIGKAGMAKHSVYGLLEIDVTAAREKLRDLRRRGREVSFTAWAMKTIACCVADHPGVHALRRGKNRAVAFTDVDVSLMVEREVEGAAVPLPLLIRAAQEKPAEEIDSEIRAALSQPIADESGHVLGSHGIPTALFRLYYALPHFLRVWIIRGLTANPFRTKALSGTVTITTVGGVGSPGWIIPTRSWHNAVFALGTVSRKPWALGDRIVIRDVLNLTVVLNHDVIDGRPAGKFVQDLVKRMEKAAGID